MKSNWKWPIKSDFVGTPFRDFSFTVLSNRKVPTRDLMFRATKFGYRLPLCLRAIFKGWFPYDRGSQIAD